MKVIILEDEKLNADRLIQLLRQLVTDLHVLDVLESVEEGIKWFENHPLEADLVFMDIQLSDGNSFEIFEKVTVRKPIIFTTAYNKFALQAFKVHSIDYILKPVEKPELEKALAKLSYFKSSAQYAIDVSKIAEEFYRRENTRFIGKINNQIVYVKSKDIAYVYFSDGITKVITFKNQKVPLDYSLDQMEKMLNRSLFFRVNRKLIVNIDAIEKISSYYNSRLILQLEPLIDNDTVVSRERVPAFKDWLEGRPFT